VRPAMKKPSELKYGSVLEKDRESVFSNENFDKKDE